LCVCVCVCLSQGTVKITVQLIILNILQRSLWHRNSWQQHTIHEWMLLLAATNTDLFRHSMRQFCPVHTQVDPPPYVPVTSDYQIKHFSIL